MHPDRAIAFIDKLRVEQLWGVGEKTAQRMHGIGVFTGRQLREIPLATLTGEFGKMGRVFYNFARGIDERPVETAFVRKSVGCETTYQTDLTDYEDMVYALAPLTAELVRRLDKHNFKGRSLVLKIKYSDFRQTTHSYTGATALETVEEILPKATTLLADAKTDGQPVRLLGLTVTGRIVPEAMQADSQLTIDW